MNVNLNPTGQVPARLLAQMRLVATTAGIAPALAAAFADGAAERGMTATLADAAARGVVFMSTTPAARNVDDATLIRLTDAFLTALTDGGQANAAADPTALAGQILLAHFGAEDAKSPIIRHTAANSVGASWDGPQALASKLADARAAAIAPMMGLRHEPTIGREFGVNPLDHARAWAREKGLRMGSDAAVMEAFATGRVPYMTGSHTTSDFPTIAGASVQILIGRALEQFPVGLATCASTITATDFRARKLANTSAASALVKVAEGGEVKFRTIDDTGEVVPAPDRYAGAFRATDELIRNASAGGFDLELAISRALLAAAQEAQRSVLAAAITGNAAMADSFAVFSTQHANLATVPVALSVTSLNVARTAMQRFVDSRGAMRPVSTGVILVPPEKQTEAEQLVALISATKPADVNPFGGALRVCVDPGLAGTGTYYWYVLPEPTTTDGLALITLDGMAVPQVETRDSWPDFGMAWRVQWPLAATFVRASWFRSVGA